MSQRDVSAVHCLSVWDVRGSSSELVLASPSSLQTLRGWPAVAVNSPWGGGLHDLAVAATTISPR